MEMSQWLYDLLCCIGFSFGLTCTFAVLVICFICLFDLNKRKKEYLDSLCEHDKSVIATYNHIYGRLFDVKNKRKSYSTKNP